MNARQITVMIARRRAGGRLALCSNLTSKGPELAGPLYVPASVYLGREPHPCSPLVGVNGISRLGHDRLSLSFVVSLLGDFGSVGFLCHSFSQRRGEVYGGV